MLDLVLLPCVGSGADADVLGLMLLPCVGSDAVAVCWV